MTLARLTRLVRLVRRLGWRLCYVKINAAAETAHVVLASTQGIRITLISDEVGAFLRRELILPDFTEGVAPSMRAEFLGTARYLSFRQGLRGMCMYLAANAPYAGMPAREARAALLPYLQLENVPT